MNPEKAKRIKKAVLKVCQKKVSQGEITYLVSDELATKNQISLIISKMISCGELSMTKNWKIRISKKAQK